MNTPAREKRKRILIYYTRFDESTLGGGEYLPLLLAAALQDTCDITFALDFPSDVARVAAIYGIPVDGSRIETAVVKPAGGFAARLDAFLPVFRTWNLKRLARKADVCISTMNMFDFGKPAHQVIAGLRHFGDNAFDDYYLRRPPKTGLSLLWRKTRTFLAEAILRPLLGVRSTRRILADPRERIHPNSRYVFDTVRSFYGPFNGEVFLPPTLAEFSAPRVPRDPLKIVSIGRVHPQKRIPDIVAVVEAARASTGLDLQLHVAGTLGHDAAHTALLRRLAGEKPWFHLVGPVFGDAKEDFLHSATYAIHAEREEPFGISVTEYLKAGLVPVVPDMGGTCEIVDTPDLSYATIPAAADILARLLRDDAFRSRMQARCAERAKVYSREAYFGRQRAFVAELLGTPPADASAAP